MSELTRRRDRTNVYLQRNYKLMSYEALAKQLGRDIEEVVRRCDELNIPRPDGSHTRRK